MSSDSHPSKMERKDFVKIVTTFLGSIMAAVIGLPLISYFITPALEENQQEDWVAVGPLESYPLGEPKVFSFTRSQVNGWERTSQSYGVYVLRQSETEVKVLSNVCTHLSCRVTWDEDDQAYICPCHDASFDKVGQVIHGPPPRPLDEYQTKVEDGTLYIYLLEG